MIYLDANATTAPSRAARDAVAQAMAALPANPSSAHSMGAVGREVVECARDAVCLLVGDADPEDVILTSGGTEGNNTVIRGFRPDGEPAMAVISAAEHPSVREPALACAAGVTEVPVSPHGMIDPNDLARSLPTDGPAPLVAFHWVNSETGVVQDVAALAGAVRRVRGDALILADAAQAVGRIPVWIEDLDALTFSGHKLHAPAGTGVLVLIDSGNGRVSPLLLGGGQERGLRSGTHNVAGAAGLAAALAERAGSLEGARMAMAEMRDAFEEAVQSAVDGAWVNGAGAPRVANTTNIGFPGIDGAALAAALDQRGVACSVGSACSAARPEPSATLLAMGLSPEQAWSSVRFSFSVMNTMAESEEAARIVAETARSLR